MKSIALFGGSFDPPHLGHVEVVEEALRTLDIEKLIVIPAYLNPFKSGSTAPAASRLHWLCMIFKDHAKVEISDFEVNQQRRVATIETVEHFKAIEPCRIFLIIGADNLPMLKKWHRYEELASHVDFVVAHRDNIEIPEGYMDLHVNSPINSTALRRSMEHHLIPPSVKEEINAFYKEHYGTDSSTEN
jgi:nicotinate-nucleotide adenylyltransferase